MEREEVSLDEVDMNSIKWVERRPMLLQFLFTYVTSVVLGLLYGGAAISYGTHWIYPGSFLRLEKIWVSLGWWDSHLTLAAMFFVMVASPLLVRLCARIWHHGSGNLALAYLGSIAGGMLSHFLFILILALPVPGGGSSSMYIGGLLATLFTVLGYNAGKKRDF